MTIDASPDLVARIAANRDRIEARIVAAGGSVDGADRVVIVGVTKFHPPELCAAAVAAGLVDLGESYAKELVAKAAAVEGARWHFIGQLQTNKVRVVADVVALYQSVDRPSLVAELARRVPGARVLIEVELAEAEGRGGCAPNDAPRLIESARASGLDVAGVMGVAPQGSEQEVVLAFRRLRTICDDEQLEVCSMGMSADLELAVSEGSNMVRVGSAIFGPRP